MNEQFDKLLQELIQRKETEDFVKNDLQRIMHQLNEDYLIYVEEKSAHAAKQQATELLYQILPIIEIMTDQFGVIYGAALILGGLFGYLRSSSLISLVLGVVLGAWTVYNATHPSRQNNVANLAIAAVLGVVMLLRFLIGGKVFPALVVVALSVGQVYRNYPHLK